MKILGVIPARGGSKGVRDKNILSLFGKPLIGYTIEAALDSNVLDKVVVSTDSDKITAVVKRLYNIEIIKRPLEFATDESPIEEALLHVVKYLAKVRKYKADIVVWMQPNVPIRKNGIVDEVVGSLVNSNADSCVTCYEVDQIPELMKIINKKGMLVPIHDDVSAIRRQEFPQRYLLDGSVVALRVKNLLNTRGIRKAHIYLGKEVIPVVQKKMMYRVEIDVSEDVNLVRYYMKQMRRIKK